MLQDVVSTQQARPTLQFCYLRIGLAGSIGPDDGGEVGVAEEEGVVALVGLEVCKRIASAFGFNQTDQDAVEAY